MFNSMKPDRGFTLIEIMIVLVIIAIAATFSVLSINAFLKKRHVETTANEISTLLPVAGEQAILQPAVLGLYLTNKQYAFYQFVVDAKTKEGKWQLLQRDQVLKPREISSDVRIGLKINNKAVSIVAGTKASPQILFLPSGDMTGFVLTIGTEDKPNEYVITGQENGAIETKKSN